METYFAILLTFLIAIFGLLFKPDKADVNKDKTYIIKLTGGGWIILITLILSSLLTVRISYIDSAEKAEKIETDSTRHKEQIKQLLKIDRLERRNFKNQKRNYENQIQITKDEAEILRLKLENANSKLVNVENKLFPVCPVRVYYNLIYNISCNEAKSLLDSFATKAGSLNGIERLNSNEIRDIVFNSQDGIIFSLFHHNYGDNSLYFDNYEKKTHLWFSDLKLEYLNFEIHSGIEGGISFGESSGPSYYLIVSLTGKGTCSSRDAAKYTLEDLFNTTVKLSIFYQKDVPECLHPTMQRVDVKIKFDNLDAFEISSINEQSSSDKRRYDYIFTNWKNREY